jgi:adenosylhomocysteine nucleosidase
VYFQGRPDSQQVRNGKGCLQLLVAFALEMEFAPWHRSRKFNRVSSDPFLYEAQVGESSVRVVVMGMGPRAAKQAMLGALGQGTRRQFDACFVCGLTGALREGFERSEIVAARQVREADSQRLLESDAGLLERAMHAGARPVTLCTASYVAATTEAKRRMSSLGDVVDMESFIVMEQAAQRGMPSLAIRAIGDLVEDELPSGMAQIINARGELQFWPAVFAVLKAPHRLPALIRFGWQGQRGAKNLAHFLDQLVAALPASPERSSAGSAVG